MKRRVCHFAALLCVALFASFPLLAQNDNQCPDYPALFVKGAQGSVISRMALPLAAFPGAVEDGNLIEIPRHATITIEINEACLDGVRWLLVEYRDFIGWVAEANDAGEFVLKPLETAASEEARGGGGATDGSAAAGGGGGATDSGAAIGVNSSSESLLPADFVYGIAGGGGGGGGGGGWRTFNMHRCL
jgi:hypothetical protein